MKGVTRVAVPVFSVEFITADSVSALTSDFAAAGRATSSLCDRLVGIDEPDLQGITDTLCAKVLPDLQASGLQVVGLEALTTSRTSARPEVREKAATAGDVADRTGDPAVAGGGLASAAGMRVARIRLER